MPKLRRRVFAALPPGRPPLVWVADPRAADVAPRFARDLLVLDAIDDWSYLSGGDRGGVERGSRLLAEAPGLTLAVNALFLARLRPRGLATVLPNAVETGDWNDVHTDADIFLGLPRPVVAYVGFLRASVDAEMLTVVARFAPEITRRLFGPASPRGRMRSATCSFSRHCRMLASSMCCSLRTPAWSLIAARVP